MTEKEKAKTKMKKSTFPDGVQAFDMQCDRKKWTHFGFLLSFITIYISPLNVAIVCTKVPKDRVVMFLDGMLPFIRMIS
jgi:hypothetical protein